MNLFATVLTYTAPSANYRGESELNRTVIQKVTDGRFDYPIISPEAMRNALREMLAGYGLPCNRTRLPDEEQLAVRFRALPNPDAYADDFFFGYLVAATGEERRAIKEAIIEDEDDPRGATLRNQLRQLKAKQTQIKEASKAAKKEKEEQEKVDANEEGNEAGKEAPEDEEESKKEEKEKKEKNETKKMLTAIEKEIKTLLDSFNAFTFKRDSVVRMNMAKALQPYRHNAVFTQSPLAAEGSAYQNAATSALLHRETCVTAFQYPFALCGNDCACNGDGCKHAEPKEGHSTTCKCVWTRRLLKAVGELNNVAGNHARSYFEMAPASIIIRLTDRLVAGYRTYCFKPDARPDLIDDILKGDYMENDESKSKGHGFYVGGEIVKRDLPEEVQTALRNKGVTLDREPQKLLEIVAKKFLGEA